MKRNICQFSSIFAMVQRSSRIYNKKTMRVVSVLFRPAVVKSQVLYILNIDYILMLS